MNAPINLTGGKQSLQTDAISPYQQVRQVDVIGWDQLDATSKARWDQIRESEPAFRSPFFSSAFSDAVHAARGDVLVALLSDGQQILGFFPFHRIGRKAVPVGRYFNDAHHVIAKANVSFDWLWLLQQCNVKAYEFHALVPQQDDLLKSYCQGTTESFSAELGNDSREFLRQLEINHRTIRRQQQKTRKMERELGPLSLEVDCRDRELLELSIQWKRNQYSRTNILDLFTPQWSRDLLRNLHDRSGTQTRGIVSVLRAGDQVVATHIGMIDRSLLHYWFPSYNAQFARYSPGTALFKEIVRVASDHGIACIDMGYGEQPYKRKQTDTITTVAHGCVTPSRTYRQWKRMTKAANNALKKVPMKEQLKVVLRTIQPTAGISKLE